MCTILQFKNAMNIVFNFLTKQSWDTCFVPVLVIPRMLPSSKSGRTKNNKRFFFFSFSSSITRFMIRAVQIAFERNFIEFIRRNE